MCLVGGPHPSLTHALLRPGCCPPQSAARVAATVLTRAAVDRGSRDNVTVVIVDLSPMTAAEVAAEEALTAEVGEGGRWGVRGHEGGGAMAAGGDPRPPTICGSLLSAEGSCAVASCPPALSQLGKRCRGRCELVRSSLLEIPLLNSCPVLLPSIRAAATL